LRFANIDSIYGSEDTSRLWQTLRLLTNQDISRWALTGGTAIEWHLRARGAETLLRPLHDLDFIAADFGCLPPGLGDVLILRHVHPHDPPGKTMLQAVDPKTAVRLDIFRAYGGEMDRALSVEFAELGLRVVAFEDLAARHARLCCSLLRGDALAPKYARDFLRMVDCIEAGRVEQVWLEHRRHDDPTTFGEAVVVLRKAIAERTDLLVAARYSTDVDEVCPRCESTEAFRLATGSRVLALLGYC
jgi:hypothetical protein